MSEAATARAPSTRPTFVDAALTQQVASHTILHVAVELRTRRDAECLLDIAPRGAYDLVRPTADEFHLFFGWASIFPCKSSPCFSVS